MVGTLLTLVVESHIDNICQTQLGITTMQSAWWTIFWIFRFTKFVSIMGNWTFTMSARYIQWNYSVTMHFLLTLQRWHGSSFATVNNTRQSTAKGKNLIWSCYLALYFNHFPVSMVRLNPGSCRDGIPKFLRCLYFVLIRCQSHIQTCLEKQSCRNTWVLRHQQVVSKLIASDN